MLPYNVTQFEVFVTEQDSFRSKFEKINTKWVNTQNAKDITKIKVNKNDPTFASLLAAYIITQKSKEPA